MLCAARDANCAHKGEFGDDWRHSDDHEDVIALVQEHRTPKSIIATIGWVKTAFDLSEEGMKALVKAGVPDIVILAMEVARNNASAADDKSPSV